MTGFFCSFVLLSATSFRTLRRCLIYVGLFYVVGDIIVIINGLCFLIFIGFFSLSYPWEGGCYNNAHTFLLLTPDLTFSFIFVDKLFVLLITLVKVHAFVSVNDLFRVNIEKKNILIFV